MTNGERVREILRLVGEMRVDELIEFFAADAVMELPFAPGRMAKRHVGKDAVLAFQQFARGSFSSFAMAVDAIHETANPNVVIAEHRSEGVVAVNGRPYRNSYVTFFTFDDTGKVTNWREYYDPAVVVRAFPAVTRFAAVPALLVLAACSSASKPKAAESTTTPTTAKPACLPSRIAPPAQSSYTFDGRTYRLALPSAYDGSRAWPLLMVFHGWASSKEAIDAETGLDRLGPRRGFIVVTPDGSSNPRTWNFISGASGSQADDYAFVDALVAHLERQLCVDAKRIYATGHSAGSAFVGFLICHKPYRFTGAAMVEATIPSTCPPNVIPKIISVHGTADPAVLYDGGKGQGQTVAIPPVRQTVAQLAQRASCDPSPRQDHPATDVNRATYTGCAKGSEVEQITIVNGGHPWAGGLQAQAEERSVPGAQFSASTEILRFLSS